MLNITAINPGSPQRLWAYQKKEDFQSQKRKERMTAYTKAKYNLYKKVWAQKANTGH